MSNMNDKSDINPPVETNYEKHQNHPAPSKEAVIEEDKNGASKVLKVDNSGFSGAFNNYLAVF